jgi:hypothetical protein
MVFGLLRQSNHQNAQPRPVRRAGHAFYRFGHWFATQVNAFDGPEAPVVFLESQDKFQSAFISFGYFQFAAVMTSSL